MQQEIKLRCITAIRGCGDQRDKWIQEMGKNDVMWMRTALISTPVTPPRPADVQRQEEMGKSLPFSPVLGLHAAAVLAMVLGKSSSVCVF